MNFIDAILQKSHNMTFKKEFQDIGLFDLLKPYGAMSWKTYMMQTDKEKALSGGKLPSIIWTVCFLSKSNICVMCVHPVYTLYIRLIIPKLKLLSVNCLKKNMIYKPNYFDLKISLTHFNAW